MEILDLGLVIAEYRPFNPDEFTKSVRKKEFTNPKWLYDSANRKHEPWQGDILPDMELAYIGADGQVFVYEGAVMLLSHGCDTVVGRDDYALAAPVVAFREYVERVPEDERGDRANNVQSNSFSNVLYLPAYGELPESCVDFAFASAVSTQRVQAACEDTEWAHRLRLSSGGWYLLTAKLAHHFARVERASDYPRRSFRALSDDPPVESPPPPVSRPWPET